MVWIRLCSFFFRGCIRNYVYLREKARSGIPFGYFNYGFFRDIHRYIVAVLCVNMLAGYVLKAASDVFLCIHVICLAIYAVIISILFTVKGAAARQRSVEDGRICEKQILIYEFEKIRSKVAEINGSVRDSAAHMIDSLLEELRFSDLASFADVSDSDDMIGKRAQILSAEVDNLIAIDSTDLSGMEAAVNDIRRMIRDRNSQIRLMSQNI